MNINRIKNITIAKLNRYEIGDLDLCNHGVMLYRGTLKSRRQCFKTIVVNEYETHFVADGGRFEFIEIRPMGDEKEYAMRAYDSKKEEYIEHIQPYVGIEFLR